MGAKKKLMQFIFLFRMRVFFFFKQRNRFSQEIDQIQDAFILVFYTHFHAAFILVSREVQHPQHVPPFEPEISPLPLFHGSFDL